MKRLTDELIRSALQHAILERESYLDAIRGCGMEEAEQECHELIAGWTAILARRYGQRTITQAIAAQGGGVTPLGQIVGAEPRAFKASPLDLRLGASAKRPRNTPPKQR